MAPTATPAPVSALAPVAGFVVGPRAEGTAVFRLGLGKGGLPVLDAGLCTARGRVPMAACMQRCRKVPGVRRKLRSCSAASIKGRISSSHTAL